MRILIVDDDALICDSLKLMIELEKDMTVAGTCKNGREAIRFFETEAAPDIVLLDIRMPVMDGVQCSAELKSRWPETKIIMLTTFRDDAYIRQAIKNGASGYLLKSQSGEAIMDTLRAAFRGSMVMSGEVAEKLSDMLHRPVKKKSETPPMDESLTGREKKVLTLIAEGRSNKEIAEKLYLSDGTVRNYITRMLEKLQLRTRTQLAVYYMECKYGKDS
ncbi:response regulator [Sporolactobacillus putidus]|uniref:DNA-binding response regulator n=1 Tax=Sporolactobacillus putidus TaxID=492735 RepID=A0A917S0H5_9BACL|nr:response regulator transcription factor [Sporolactobacillus putidus]GGL45158.1 DNA-binding response regulator [Sporolactobacillus putidus]